MTTTVPSVVAAALALTGCIGPDHTNPPASAPTPAATTSAFPQSTTTLSPQPTTDTTAGPTLLTVRPTGIPGTPRGALPDPTTVDGVRPEAVAAWVLTAWYGYDTDLDTGPADTARRALPWLTPHLAATVREAAPIAASGAQWTTWTQVHAYATVTITPAADDHPQDTALNIDRQYAVQITMHPHGSDHHVAYLHLTRTSLTDTWRVDDVLTR